MIYKRQIIHDTRNEGMKKCLSAVMRMKVLNDSIKYTALDLKLSAENALESFAEFDVIVDATDNFQARYFDDNYLWLWKITVISFILSSS